jgi:hypothetical protein
MRLVFPLTTKAGAGRIVFAWDGSTIGNGRVTKVEIPDPRARREWKRQVTGNPECHVLPGGAEEPDDVTENVFTVTQTLRSMSERIPGFEYMCPELPAEIRDAPEHR